MSKRSGKGRITKNKLLHGEALENAVTDALENREPWASICHRLHVGTRLIQQVREKHFPSRVIEEKKNENNNSNPLEMEETDQQEEGHQDHPGESGNSSSLDVSKVLRLFEREKGPVEVAIELKLHSNEDFRDVQRVYEEWKKVKERDLPSDTVSCQLKDLSERVADLEASKNLGNFAATAILLSAQYNTPPGNQKVASLLHLSCPLCFDDLIPFGEGMDSGYKCSHPDCGFSLTWQDIEKAAAP